MESARLMANLTIFFIEMVKRVMEAVSKLDEEYDAASLEEFVRDQVAALGAVVFEYCSSAQVPRAWPARVGRVHLRPETTLQGPRRTHDTDDSWTHEPDRAFPLPLSELPGGDDSRRQAQG